MAYSIEVASILETLGSLLRDVCAAHKTAEEKLRSANNLLTIAAENRERAERKLVDRIADDKLDDDEHYLLLGKYTALVKDLTEERESRRIAERDRDILQAAHDEAVKGWRGEHEARRKAEERAKGQTDDARRAIAELQQARAAEEAAVREAEDLRAQVATARGAASTWESVAVANKATAEQARASVAELERKVEELTAERDEALAETKYGVWCTKRQCWATVDEDPSRVVCCTTYEAAVIIAADRTNREPSRRHGWTWEVKKLGVAPVAAEAKCETCNGERQICPICEEPPGDHGEDCVDKHDRTPDWVDCPHCCNPAPVDASGKAGT